MAPLTDENRRRAEEIVAVYPERRSALVPLCHLAQSQEGHLSEEAMVDIASLCGVSPAEVRGTASFYDMLHTEPVGRYVIAVCTNIACMLAGAYPVLRHAEERLGIYAGQTTGDGLFTLEEAECVAGCDNAVCVQVNHRFFGPIDEDGFDRLVSDLAGGALAETVPPHGVLNRVSRSVGLLASNDGSSTISANPQAAGEAPTPAAGAVPPSGGGRRRRRRSEGSA